jgi:hypothetical protein
MDGGGKMDFSRIILVGTLVSTLISINSIPTLASEIESSFGQNSVVVSSQWSASKTFNTDELESTLAKALSKNSVFKSAVVGGHEVSTTSVANRFNTDEHWWNEMPQESGKVVHTYYFLKPSYSKLPTTLLTFERRGADGIGTSGVGSADFTLIEPTHFYYEYIDVARRSFDSSQIHLNLSFTQMGSEIQMKTSLRISELSFVTWVNSFLKPIFVTQTNITQENVLIGVRMIFEAIHQYFANNY